MKLEIEGMERKRGARGSHRGEKRIWKRLDDGGPRGGVDGGPRRFSVRRLRLLLRSASAKGKQGRQQGGAAMARHHFIEVVHGETLP